MILGRFLIKQDRHVNHCSIGTADSLIWYHYGHFSCVVYHGQWMSLQYHRFSSPSGSNVVEQTMSGGSTQLTCFSSATTLATASPTPKNRKRQAQGYKVYEFIEDIDCSCDGQPPHTETSFSTSYFAAAVTSTSESCSSATTTTTVTTTGATVGATTTTM